MGPRSSPLIRRVIVAATLAVAAEWAGAQGPASSTIQLTQGEVILFSHRADGATLVSGTFSGRPIVFFRGETPGGWSALLGADLDDRPGPAELILDLVDTGDRRTVRVPVDVRSAAFGTQALILPKRMVDLDAKTLARVTAEQARVTQLLGGIHPERLWRGPFLLPVEGEISRTFGMRRLLNDQPRSPHAGEDIVAPQGAPVRAAHHGVVRLVAEHFFSGKSVILDHGLGLFTLYFHLSETSAREGASVARGQTIGRVGATGRVTGPHLHWGAVLSRARVNPLSLLALPAQ